MGITTWDINKLKARITDKKITIRNELNFWNVHGIMNTSGLLLLQKVKSQIKCHVKWHFIFMWHIIRVSALFAKTQSINREKNNMFWKS